MDPWEYKRAIEQARKGRKRRKKKWDNYNTRKREILTLGLARRQREDFGIAKPRPKPKPNKKEKKKNFTDIPSSGNPLLGMPYPNWQTKQAAYGVWRLGKHLGFGKKTYAEFWKNWPYKQSMQANDFMWPRPEVGEKVRMGLLGQGALWWKRKMGQTDLKPDDFVYNKLGYGVPKYTGGRPNTSTNKRDYFKYLKLKILNEYKQYGIQKTKKTIFKKRKKNFTVRPNRPY